jgi:hypothetical protein
VREILIMIFIAAFSCGSVCAQGLPGPEKMQKEMEKMNREFEARQAEEMERLKKSDPVSYQQRKDAADAQAKIAAVITAFQQGQISLAQAEGKLYPLVKQDVKSFADSLNTEIAHAEKRLEYLKKAKADPEFLIRKRIDSLLGKSVPSLDETF